MKRKIITAVIVTIFAPLLSACAGDESKAQKVVEDKLGGARIEKGFFSKDREFYCGAVSGSGENRRFFSRWRFNSVTVDGDGDYSVHSFVRNCDVTLTASTIEAEARLTAERERARRQTEAADRAAAKRMKWLRENETAIQAIDQAADRAREKVAGR